MIAKFFSLLIPMFILMDFIGTIPIFIALTKDFTQKDKIRVAFLSSAAAGTIVLFFSLLGREIMTYFSISIEAVKVGGGLLLLYIAFQMILSNQFSYEHKETRTPGSIIISPLAIPMLAGPGCMTFGMISYAGLIGIEKIYLITAIVLAAVIGALLLSVSSVIDKLLGREFSRGLEKIMAVVVSFISAEMVLSGIKAYFGF